MKNLYLLTLLSLLIAACQPPNDQPFPCAEPCDEPVIVTYTDLNSGCPVEKFTLTDESGAQYGWAYAQADSVKVRVTLVPAYGWLIQNSYLYLNACEDVPSTPGGYPLAHSFPHSLVNDDPQTQHTYDIVLGEGDSCFCIMPFVELVYVEDGCIIDETGAWAGDTYVEDCGDWYAYIDYCLPACACGSSQGPNDPDDPSDPDSCSVEPGEFRTQTQGGWGSVPNGGNPGSYLTDNFDAAFPNGIVIGCNYFITLTSAQAVTDFIPQGGPPTAISQNYTNPTQGISVLAGQVLALTLSTGFDNYDQQFGSSTNALENLVIVSGPLVGQTVAYALDEGNRALGGCSTTYSISDVNSVLSQINENFVDGTENNSYLECP